MGFRHPDIMHQVPKTLGLPTMWHKSITDLEKDWNYCLSTAFWSCFLEVFFFSALIARLLVFCLSIPGMKYHPPDRSLSPQIRFSSEQMWVMISWFDVFWVDWVSAFVPNGKVAIPNLYEGTLLGIHLQLKRKRGNMIVILSHLGLDISMSAGLWGRGEKLERTGDSLGHGSVYPAICDSVHEVTGQHQ